MILIVSYDLKSVKDYTPFFEALKREGTYSWWHYLSSTWLLSTSRTPENVANAMRPYLGPSDFLLVGEFGKTYNGWLPKEAWEWIAAQSQPVLPGFTNLAALLGSGVDRAQK
jgi:hypothetical protein